jgi:hypothetical protein
VFQTVLQHCEANRGRTALLRVAHTKNRFDPHIFIEAILDGLVDYLASIQADD